MAWFPLPLTIILFGYGLIGWNWMRLQFPMAWVVYPALVALLLSPFAVFRAESPEAKRHARNIVLLNFLIFLLLSMLSIRGSVTYFS